MSIPMTTEQRMWQKVRIIFVIRAARLLFDSGTTHVVSFRDEAKERFLMIDSFSNAPTFYRRNHSHSYHSDVWQRYIF